MNHANQNWWILMNTKCILTANDILNVHRKWRFMVSFFYFLKSDYLRWHCSKRKTLKLKAIFTRFGSQTSFRNKIFSCKKMGILYKILLLSERSCYVWNGILYWSCFVLLNALVSFENINKPDHSNPKKLACAPSLRIHAVRSKFSLLSR